MKVFLSYRRDDTGGRAGRLFDVFASKYGAQKVFQDVSSATAGLDFTQRIEATIADSDVVLVVIGPNWLTSVTADGSRRIDQPDDFVRREVGSALSTGKPVVPVLVDSAALPSREQLPDELAGLISRQAVSLRDATWHHDVDNLIRQLEGDPLPLVGRRRRRLMIAAAGAVVAIAAAVVVVVASNGDDPSTADSTGGTDGTESDGLTTCPPIDDGSWTTVPVVEAPPLDIKNWPGGEDKAVQVSIANAWTRSGPDGPELIVAIDVSNTTAADPSFSDNVDVNEGIFAGLFVDRTSQEGPWCLSFLEGDDQLDSNERAVVAFGFEKMTIDPAHAPIKVKVFYDTDMVVVSNT